MEKSRVLYKHFDSIRDELLHYFNHTGLSKHSDIKGIAREGFVESFLKKNLPSLIEYNLKPA